MNKSSFSPDVRLCAAFFAGQITLLGMIALLRPPIVHAQTEPQAVTAPALVVRKSVDGAGIQLAAVSAGGGPSLSFFDAGGASRLQLSLDAKGTPTVILRGKTGKTEIGIGLKDDQPIVAVRGADGTMQTVPLPGESDKASGGK